MSEKAKIAVALKSFGIKSYMFDYLDWCKEQGMSFEQTQDFDVATRFGKEMHRKGIELNGLQFAELYES